jgi:uncharacterized membrane protein YczE
MGKKNKILLIAMIVGVFVLTIFLSWVNSPETYINKPFGNCEENFSVSYGSFKSCGNLMSRETAEVGMWSIFLGLPLLSFFVLPLLVKLKGSGCR